MDKYLEILKKYGVSAMLLPNCDDFSLEHCEGSPLHKLSGFLGSAGEGLLMKDGTIYLFVDPRYHIKAESCSFPNVKVVKMSMGQNFLSEFSKYLKKDDKILLDEKFVKLSFYNKFLEKCEGKFDLIVGDFEKRCPLIPVKSEINKTECEKKIKKLKKELKADNIFISDLSDVSYLSGLVDFSIPYYSSPRVKMLIRGDKIQLINSETPEISEETVVFYNDITLSDFNKIKKPKIILKNPIKEFASIKSSKELSLMKENFKKLDLALLNFEKQIKEGLSEFELKEMFEKELFLCGAKSLSFKTILSIGENTASIHYSEWDKKKILKQGDLILLDCGGYWENGIATDITRVFCCGKPSELQKEIYTIVLKAHLNCYHSKLKTGFGLDSLARKIFSKYNLDGFEFPHALGHGVGICVHAYPPLLSPSYHKALKEGMTFSIEPGLYKENVFGIRIENTVYMDKDFKKKSFSKFHFEKKLINFDMLTKKEQKWLEEWI